MILPESDGGERGAGPGLGRLPGLKRCDYKRPAEEEPLSAGQRNCWLSVQMNLVKGFRACRLSAKAIRCLHMHTEYLGWGVEGSLQTFQRRVSEI